MGRLKTFGLYLMMLIGFFIISVILENGLIAQMYKPLEGFTPGTAQVDENSGITTEVIDARGTSVNGFIRVKATNTTGHDIDKCYAKVDLLNKYGQVAATEYVEIDNWKNGESRELDIDYKGNDITGYKISYVEEKPEPKEGVIDVLGYEIDTKDIFGIDLSKYLDLDMIKAKGLGLWNWFKLFCKSIPTWAYVIAIGIVIWNLPRGYLLGIFPL